MKDVQVFNGLECKIACNTSKVPFLSIQLVKSRLFSVFGVGFANHEPSFSLLL